MPDPPRYYSNASRKPRVAPEDLPFAIGVTAAPESPWPVGMAFPDGSVADDRGRLEQAWRLVVRGGAIAGRWALSGGEFVKLAGGRERKGRQGARTQPPSLACWQRPSRICRVSSS
jgi:hypothetical protein